MGLIEDFITHYRKEYDFYEHAARLVAQALEADLQSAGVRAIVTSRAKSVYRLTEKCHQRNASRAYQSIDEIYDDIVDLAGVRVALYFPAERDRVDGAINRLFQVNVKKEFPEPGESGKDKQFAGYSAAHYRVQLKEQALDDAAKRYADARIEVQVASVLMHAWAEVEHDLVYKPLAGILSADELSLLNQLNGLVLIGEITLEHLQRAGETRVATGERLFQNHYDLAAHLLSRAAGLTSEPIGDAGLGRIDILFDFLSRLEIGTPDQIAPYLDALHGDVERRPLAEQLIDAILTENPERYEVYLSVQREALMQVESVAVQTQVGALLSSWVQLERAVRQFIPDRSRLTSHLLVSEGLIEPGSEIEFDNLRRMRNAVVHGIDVPDADTLAGTVRRVQAMTAEIARRGNAGRRQSGDEDVS